MGFLKISPIVSFALVTVLLSATGCSSYFKRKDCEGTNWYEYGQRVALSGRRLSGDQFVSECKRVEAEFSEAELDRGFKQGMSRYCQPTYAFTIGKNGEGFSPEMCDGENIRVLVDKHLAGVLEYCQRSNGFSAGAKGSAYNGICPRNLEGAFVPEFNRGRKSYLTVLLNENERKIGDIDHEISKLESERNLKQFEAQNLLVPQLTLERILDPSTGIHREQYISKVTPERQRAADDTRMTVQRLESEIGSKRRSQSELRDRNSKIRLEAVALDTKGEG